MEYSLTHLIDSLESSLKVLKGPLKSDLENALHNHDVLPDKQTAKLAARAVDLLHETQLLLEPDTLRLADCFLGHINTTCLNAAVELGIPDALLPGPLTLPVLAAAVSARPDRLAQVLRVLHNNGIFAYSPAAGGTYSNNAASLLLTRTHWTQWRNWVDLYGTVFYDIGRSIPASLRAGESRMAAQIEFGTDKDMFAHFADRGWVGRLHRTLSGGAVAQAPGILEDYPWESFAGNKFLDVGGGGGGLVALVLRRHGGLAAGVLDLERAIEQAAGNFHGEGGEYADVGARVAREDLVVDDFLREVPPFKVYTMKWCLHDWDDSKALRVMGNIRRAIVPDPANRLVVFESILADGRMGRLSRYGDVTMAVSANGMERTEPEWRSLAERTGWRVREIYPLRNAWVCAIELVPDWESQWERELVGEKESVEASLSGGLEEPEGTVESHPTPSSIKVGA